MSAPTPPSNAAHADLRIKAVPGASRDAIAGMLGDRVKVRVSAPPEGGKANRAICAMIAQALGVKASQVTVVAGPTHAEKTVRIAAVAPGTVEGWLAGLKGTGHA